MGRNVFSSEGKKYYDRKLRELTDKATASGKAVGEAAGDNCDWHDNFDYEDATRTFEMASRRRRELQEALSNVEIIVIQEQTRRVAIGNTVELESGNGKRMEMTVGAWGESAPHEGLVSYTAPLAHAILGAEEGDEVNFRNDVLSIKKIHPASYKYRALIAKIFAVTPA